jgi:hypothetical protein
MFREAIKRAHLLCRLGVAVSVLVAAVSVVVLSTAARRPYRSQNGVTWHISKASRMNVSACHRPTRVQKVEIWSLKAVEVLAAPRSPEEAPARTLPVAIRAHHFRAPPLLS